MKMPIVLLTAFVTHLALPCMAQNAMSGPVGLYGTAYNASTTLLNGGSVFVGSGGNWVLGGSIVGANKGNPNSPTGMGQAEVITFDGTGTISGGVTAPGAAGNYINAYAATTGTATSALVLPVGGSSAVYPFTVPAGAAVTVAYFDGSGSSTNVPVSGTATTEFSEYYDLPAGIPAGSYSLSYPSGLTPGFNAILNSASGASFSLMTNIPNLSNSAGAVVSATLPATPATRLYLSTSLVVLAIQLESFQGSRQPRYNLLQWTVADSRQIDHFELTKQGNGAGVFVPLQSIPASDTILEYAYQDITVDADDYYRLLIIGKDGSVARSQIILLHGANNPGQPITLRPNPVGSMLCFTPYSQNKSQFFCSIFDMKAQQIAQKVFTVEGNGSISWDISGLSKGTYLLTVRNIKTGQSQNIQFIKL